MTSSPSRYNENDGDEDHWMYTLYDFQENGIVTKQVRYCFYRKHYQNCIVGQ